MPDRAAFAVLTGGFTMSRTHTGDAEYEIATNWSKSAAEGYLGATPCASIPIVSSVSCGSAGNCVVSGNYVDGHGHLQGFVA